MTYLEKTPKTYASHAISFACLCVLFIGLYFALSTSSQAKIPPTNKVLRISMVAPSLAKVKAQQQVAKASPILQEAKAVEVVKQAVKPVISKQPKRKKVVKKTPAKTTPKEITKQLAYKPSKQITRRVSNKTSGTGTVNKIARKASSGSKAISKPVNAAYLNNPKPNYPRVAKRRNYQGTVLLDVLVKTNGQPKQVKLAKSSNYNMLDEAALAAVKNWKFVPAKQGQRYVEASVTVPIVFRLN